MDLQQLLAALAHIQTQMGGQQHMVSPVPDQQMPQQQPHPLQQLLQRLQFQKMMQGWQMPHLPQWQAPPMQMPQQPQSFDLKPQNMGSYYQQIQNMQQPGR